MSDHEQPGTDLIDTQITPEYEAICARENLAHIGSIQSTGFLLVGQTQSGNIVQLSENAPAMLGGKFAQCRAEQLLGQPVTRIIGASWTQAMRLAHESLAPISVPLFDTEHFSASAWHCLAHRADRYLLLEFLPAVDATPEHSIADDTLNLRDAVATITDTDSVSDLAQRTARAFQSLTGFDRVMVYRFLPDWSGEVIAEATADSHPVLYLGSRFPASDIPAQARALYDTAGVRLITDTCVEVAAMVPPTPADHDQPLDMSRCLLRAVSFAHLDYLASMAVRQSMSVAIHHDEKLWGLIACHKGMESPIPTARFPEIIKAADRISGLVESALEEQLEREIRDEAREHSGQPDSARGIIHSTLSAARAIGYQNQALAGMLGRIRERYEFQCVGAVIDSQSIMVCDDGELQEDDICVADLARLYDEYKRMTGKSLLETRTLQRDFPDAPTLPGVVGLLVYRPIEYSRLLVFLGLSEFVETVTWAGNPNTVRTAVVDDRIAVRPRNSFEKWRVAERGNSRFWTPRDQKILFEIANGLRIWMTQRERSQPVESHRESR